jgi:ABC-type amino acid transport substrate-binding protein
MLSKGEADIGLSNKLIAFSIYYSPDNNTNVFLIDLQILAFGGLTLTSSRQKNLKFSFPIFETGLLILTQRDDDFGL